jgi:hypothetical protein
MPASCARYYQPNQHETRQQPRTALEETLKEQLQLTDREIATSGISGNW